MTQQNGKWTDWVTGISVFHTAWASTAMKTDTITYA